MLCAFCEQRGTGDAARHAAIRCTVSSERIGPAWLATPFQHTTLPFANSTVRRTERPVRCCGSSDSHVAWNCGCATESSLDVLDNTTRVTPRS